MPAGAIVAHLVNHRWDFCELGEEPFGKALIISAVTRAGKFQEDFTIFIGERCGENSLMRLFAVRTE